MKLFEVFLVILVSTGLFTLSGCQDQQLADCQQENAELQARIEQQQKEIDELNNNQEQLAVLMDMVVRENEKMKKAAQTRPPSQSQTPEQKENIRKGLQQLFELREKSAQEMKNK